MTRTAENDGSSSICTMPEFHPIRYHWFAEVPGERVMDVVRRVIDAIDMPPLDRERLKGEMAGRLRKLKEGELTPRRHIAGPVDSVTDLNIYEVRGGIDNDVNRTVQIRIYHVEPANLRRRGGSTVVGLHVHHKVTEEGVDANELQDAELQHARLRYYEGRNSTWGGAALPTV